MEDKNKSNIFSPSPLFTMQQFINWSYGIIISFFFVSFVFYIFTNYPVFYSKLIVEDGIVEYATFSSYFFAAIIFFLSAIKSKSKSPIGPTIFAVGCFILAMEEISWGQRFFSLQSNSFFLENNLQKEINLHNLFHHRAFLVIFFSGVLSWAVLWPVLLRTKFSILLILQEKLNVPLVPTILWPSFCIACFFLVLDSPKRGEEIYELYLGVLFFISALQGGDLRLIKKVSYFVSNAGLALILSVCSFPNDTYNRVLLELVNKAYLPKSMCKQALLLHNKLKIADHKTYEVKISHLEVVYRLGNDYSDLLKNMLLENSASNVDAVLSRAEIYQVVDDNASVLIMLDEIDIKNNAIDEFAFLRYVKVLVSIENMNALNDLSSIFELRRSQSVNKQRFESIDRSIHRLQQVSSRKIEIENFLFNDVLSRNTCIR